METRKAADKGAEMVILNGLIRQSKTNVAVRHELKTNLIGVLERELGRKLTDAEVVDAKKLAQREGLLSG